MALNKPKIIAKAIGSELMLYNPELDEVHILNSTAQLIYSLFNEGKAEDEIVRQLQERFPRKTDRDLLIGDIEECLEALQGKGLILRQPNAELS